MINLKRVIQDNKQRLVTGLVLFSGVVLVLALGSFFWIWLVLGVIYGFAFYEMVHLREVESKYFYYIGATLLWLIAGVYPAPIYLILIVLLLLACVMLYSQQLAHTGTLLFLYPSSSMLLMLSVYHVQGAMGLFWLVVAVSATDIGAYFVGKRYGKRAFSQLSPSKTQEGVLGGVLCGTLLGGIVGVFVVTPLLAFVIAMAMAIAAVAGDLFESYLKRVSKVKDSGTLLPGHGGVLDRIDGHLFAVVVLFVLTKI